MSSFVRSFLMKKSIRAPSISKSPADGTESSNRNSSESHKPERSLSHVVPFGLGYTFFLGNDADKILDDDEDEEAYKKNQVTLNLLYFSFCVAEFVFGANSSMCITYFPPKALEYGITQTQIGVILGFTGVGAIFSSFFYDYCLQVFKRRSIWFWSTIIQSIFAVFFRYLFMIPGLPENIPLFFLVSSLSQFLIGLSRIGVSNLGIGTTSIIFAGQNVAPRIGLLLSSYALGILAGPFIGNYFYTAFDSPAPFFSIAVVLCANMLTSIWYLPEFRPPKSKRKKGTNFKILCNHRNLLNYFSLFIGSCVNRFMWSGIAIYITKEYELDYTEDSRQFTFAAIGSFCVGLFSAALLKCIDPRYIHFFLGLLLPGIGCLLVGPLKYIGDLIGRSSWISATGFFLENIQGAVQVSTSNTDILNNMRAIEQREPLKITKDRISNHVTTVNLSGLIIGPMSYSFLTIPNKGNVFGYDSYPFYMSLFGIFIIFYSFFFLIVTRWLSAKKFKPPQESEDDTEGSSVLSDSF